MYSIVDVFQNLNKEKRALLTDGEVSLLLEYIYFWNNHGRKTNMIAPRNSAICNVHGITKKTFYKRRKALEEKGFIKVESQQFQPLKDGKHRHMQGQGRQKPAVIRLADWLIKSNKIAVDVQQPSQKAEQKEVPKVQQTTPNRPISVAKLEQYGKDLAVQIGANTAVYPKQLERIKKYESQTSNEVIKLVREYTEKHNNSNAWAYYEATLEDVVKNHVENIADLEKYNPKLAGKSFKPVQQKLPMMAVIKNKQETTYKTKYVRGKRVEQGTDWNKKKPTQLSIEELNTKAREYLGLTANQEWPEEYANLSPNERCSKALKAGFERMERENSVAE